MDLPKNFYELGIWSLMQFPVLAAAAFIAWLVGRETARRYERLLDENRRSHAELVAEKDKRLADRDQRIRELQVEIAELKAKLSRKKKSAEEEP